MDDSTPELFIIFLSSNHLTLQAVTPVTDDARRELLELDRRGLVKYIIIDDAASCIADKRSLDKFLRDLSLGNRCRSEIVDRSPDGRSLLQIYASNIGLRKLWLSAEEYEMRLSAEDEILQNYTTICRY